MKRWILVLALAAIVSVTGCSGLQVKSDMAAEMSIDAAQGQEIVLADAHRTLTADDARIYLAGPALALKTYYDTATVNWFKYAFGTAKIYATPALYAGLQAIALDAVENAKRAPTSPDQDVKIRAVLEAQAIVNVDQARRAVKP